MLDKIVKKSKKIIKKIKKEIPNIPKNLIIGFYVLLFMLVFIIITSLTNKDVKSNEIEQNNDSIIEMFNKIDNNYQMKVTVINNSNETKYTYNTDGNIELYELNSNDNIGYFKYKNNVYQMDENQKITKLNSIPDFINDPYQNISLIKSLISKAEFENKSRTNTSVYIQISDYINEYNVIYGKSYDSFSLDKMELNVYFQSKINKIEIDYTNINKMINRNSNSLKYILEFSNYNKNDYSEIINYINSKIE